MIMGAQMREAARRMPHAFWIIYMRHLKNFAICYPHLPRSDFDVTFPFDVLRDHDPNNVDVICVHASFGPLHSKHVSHIPVW